MSNTQIVTHTPANEWMQLADFSDRVCQASLLPEHLKNKPADCLLVAMQAQRWKMDFLAVAGCTSIVRGKLMFEGKLVAAAINTSGRLTGTLNHKFTGEAPPKLSVTIIGKLQGEDTPREWEVQWDEGFKHAQDKGQWNASPKKRLLYFATREWARVHMPEVMLGVVADDEQLPVSETPANNGVTMPTTAEVSVRDVTPEPTPEVETVEAETLEVVKPELTQEEMDVLDFIAVINEYTEGNGLTRAVNEQLSSFKEPHKAKVKAAIFKRSKELGLVWNVEAKAFQPLA